MVVVGIIVFFVSFGVDIYFNVRDASKETYLEYIPPAGMIVGAMLFLPAQEPQSSGLELIVAMSKSSVGRFFLKLIFAFFVTCAAKGVSLGISKIFSSERGLSKKWTSPDKEESWRAFSMISMKERERANRIKQLNPQLNDTGWFWKHDIIMERIAMQAVNEEVRIAAIRELRNVERLRNCMENEKNEKIRQVIQSRLQQRQSK